MVVLTTMAGAAAITGGKGGRAGAGAVAVAVTADKEEAFKDVGTSAAGGISIGFIAGAGVTGTLSGAGNGAVAGGLSSSAVSASSLGGGVLAAGGGIGLLVLGASNNSNEDGTTFDCWKQIIHDESKEPSRGMLLKDIYSHPNVLKVTATEEYRPDLPKIVIENIWNEVFQIEYILVHATGKIVCHALPV